MTGIDFSLSSVEFTYKTTIFLTFYTKILFLIMCICLWGYQCACRYPSGPKASDTLKLDLWATVSDQTDVGSRN